MQKRIDDLSSNHSTMSRKEVRKRLEAWDQDQGRAMAAAEAVLKVNPKQYNWSPRLRNAGIMYRYWRLRLREHLTRVDYSNTFARWESQQQEYDSQFKLPDPSRSFDVTKVRVHLTAAKKTLQKMQSDSTTLWLKIYYDLLAPMMRSNPKNPGGTPKLSIAPFEGWKNDKCSVRFAKWSSHPISQLSRRFKFPEMQRPPVLHLQTRLLTFLTKRRRKI